MRVWRLIRSYNFIFMYWTEPLILELYRCGKVEGSLKFESNIVVSRSLVAFWAIRQQSRRIISLSHSHPSETSCSISEEFKFFTVSRWPFLYRTVVRACELLVLYEISNKCMFIRDVRIKIYWIYSRNQINPRSLPCWDAKVFWQLLGYVAGA